MTVTGRLRVTDTRPLYAVAGVGDLAVERLRHRFAALRGALTVEPRTVGNRVRAGLGTLQHDVTEWPARTRGSVRARLDKALHMSMTTAKDTAPCRVAGSTMSCRSWSASRSVDDHEDRAQVTKVVLGIDTDDIHLARHAGHFLVLRHRDAARGRRQGRRRPHDPHRRGPRRLARPPASGSKAPTRCDSPPLRRRRHPQPDATPDLEVWRPGTTRRGANQPPCSSGAHLGRHNRPTRRRSAQDCPWGPPQRREVGIVSEQLNIGGHLSAAARVAGHQLVGGELLRLPLDGSDPCAAVARRRQVAVVAGHGRVERDEDDARRLPGVPGLALTGMVGVTAPPHGLARLLDGPTRRAWAAPNVVVSRRRSRSALIIDPAHGRRPTSRDVARVPQAHQLRQGRADGGCRPGGGVRCRTVVHRAGPAAQD